MDLESAAAELYGVDPDAFIPRRTELVRAARLAGDRSLAAAIGKLRKPTRSAWLVNLYARSAAEELAELLELGAALRVAQEQLSATELRRLSTQRNAVLTAASRRAVTLAEARGYRATETVRQEVSQTLQAALAEPAVAEQVRAGVVTEAHSYGGFGPLIPSPNAAAPPGVAPSPTAGEVSESAPDEPPMDELERARARRAREEQLRAEQARTEAEHRLHAAEAALDRAADEAEEAAEQVAELADQITALKSQLSDIEQTKTLAEQRAADTQATVAELQGQVRAAREAYDAL
ncbi:hypothetical protein MLP_04860 [Microlunatus phosphovorus NM-1]|uniref:Uncharacterized protein n=1 Tax=Microlunatus phosphovorus (strain ATCC 700054 / DSM 10555 / JCM 9379 / NBRC 101784 / NCIMB 13414 / VKM Ac-1990 / NM-1) TaxID=1032480 RepID=F5XK04_MICPN|nr:hypothetical protein [Microlunatus phosphovorus]BAK33500.1 hypothetical protein MLP_04860 [Microlunatus phosphovorus NM-1]